MEEETLFVNDFRMLPKSQQIDVCECLFSAFLDDMISSDVTSVDECIQKIKTIYTLDHNRFFVFYNKTNQLIAFACIDFTQLTSFAFPTLSLSVYPCLSNLYVSPACRNQGIAQSVIQFIEYYIQQKFPASHDLFLWCETSLIPFYQRLNGTIVPSTGKSVTYMKIPF
jgi:hypothetical protein